MKHSKQESAADSRTKADARWTQALRLRLPKASVVDPLPNAEVAALVTDIQAALQEQAVPLPAADLVCEVESNVLASFPAVAFSGVDETRFLHAVVSLAGAPTPSIESWLFLVGSITIRLRIEPVSGKKTVERGSQQKQSAGDSGVAFDPKRFKNAIECELEGLPAEFDPRRAALRAMHEACRSVIARAYEPALNEKARALPQATYEEKKALAKWVSGELRELGLTLREPKTGMGAILRAHGGGTPGAGRFHLETTDASGVRHRPLTSSALPRLELMVDDLSRASYLDRSEPSR